MIDITQELIDYENNGLFYVFKQSHNLLTYEHLNQKV